MGETHAQLTVTNLFTKTRMQIRARVDTGCALLTVTQKVAKELGFDPSEFSLRRVVLADGRSVEIPTVGPIELRFEERSCTTDAYVMGDQCLMGFIPLEALDLMVDPLRQSLVGRHPGGMLHRV
jgi:clan AA aspartic protease